MKCFYMYILKCCDGSYYTGHTDNIDKRLSEHKEGKVDCYTASRLPIELVFAQIFEYRDQAIAVEVKIKKWLRNKKEALIKKDWNELKRLASRAKIKKCDVHGSRRFAPHHERNID